MKKTVTANISGKVFNIEDDAYFFTAVDDLTSLVSVISFLDPAALKISGVSLQVKTPVFAILASGEVGGVKSEVYTALVVILKSDI